MPPKKKGIDIDVQLPGGIHVDVHLGGNKEKGKGKKHHNENEVIVQETVVI